MIKQLPSKKVEEYLKSNPKCVLLDVRSEEEWNTDCTMYWYVIPG